MQRKRNCVVAWVEDKYLECKWAYLSSHCIKLMSLTSLKCMRCNNFLHFHIFLPLFCYLFSLEMKILLFHIHIIIVFYISHIYNTSKCNFTKVNFSHQFLFVSYSRFWSETLFFTWHFLDFSFISILSQQHFNIKMVKIKYLKLFSVIKYFCFEFWTYKVIIHSLYRMVFKSFECLNGILHVKCCSNSSGILSWV